MPVLRGFLAPPGLLLVRAPVFTFSLTPLSGRYVAFDDPTELPRALIFLGSAVTIVWSIQYSAKASTDHK